MECRRQSCYRVVLLRVLSVTAVFAAEECGSPQVVAGSGLLQSIRLNSLDPPTGNDLTMSFGGWGHHNFHGGPMKGLALRPEYVITEHFSLSSGVWEACAEGQSCFRSTSVADRFTKGTGDVDRIEGTLADSRVSAIALEAHIDCPSGQTSVFEFQLLRLKNAVADVYFNLEKIGHFENGRHDDGKTYQYLEIQVQDGKVNTIRVELRRMFQEGQTHIIMDIDAYNITKDFLQCMEGKEEEDHCLENLDANSTDAKLIRSDHTFQRSCLESGSQSSTCQDWRGCLSDTTQGHLLNVLRAAAPSHKEAALLGTGRKDTNETDHATCISPDSADPVSWDCDCAESFNAACEDLGMEKDEVCYRLLLCESEDVCQAWKEDAGCAQPGGALLAMTRRQRTRVRRDRSAQHGEALDGAVSAKACAR